MVVIIAKKPEKNSMDCLIVREKQQRKHLRCYFSFFNDGNCFIRSIKRSKQLIEGTIGGSNYLYIKKRSYRWIIFKLI